MRARRALQAAILGAAAASGLVGAHVLAYLLATPSATVRAELLHATGHGYLPEAGGSAVLLGIVALIMAAGAAVAARSGSDAAPLRWGTLAVRLTVAQCVGFVALELGERLVATGTLAHLSATLLLLGLVVQVVVAVGAAWLLVLLGRVVAAAVGEVPSGIVRPRTAGVPLRPRTGHRPPPGVAAPWSRRRAPPHPVVR